MIMTVPMVDHLGTTFDQTQHSSNESQLHNSLQSENGDSRVVDDSMNGVEDDSQSANETSQDSSQNNTNGHASPTQENGDTSQNASSQPERRPKRAAATAANERMQTRSRTKGSESPTKVSQNQTVLSATDPVSSAEDSVLSPPRKRVARRAGKDVVATSVKNIAAAIRKKPVRPASASPEREPEFRAPKVPKSAPRSQNKLNNVMGKKPVSAGKKGQKAAVSDDSIRNLYGMIRAGETSNTVNDVVDLWLDDFRNDHIVGFLELANFFVHASGCHGKVLYSMRNTKHADIIRDMSKRFDEESSEYPLIKSGPEFRKVRGELASFLEQFIYVIKDSVIFDGFLVPTLIEFLTEMSESPIRAFRHTATFGVMKMLTAIVEAMAELTRKIDVEKKQLDGEEKKKRPANQRLQTLRQSVQQLTSNHEQMKAIFDKAFKTVFHNRYRDTAAIIRELCIEELGKWMSFFPSRFVDDSYLKYLGWLLNDKESAVRKRCLTAIAPLYEDDKMTDKLRLFSDKFKARFVEMVADVDLDVAARAARVLSDMEKNQPETFGELDLEKIFAYVFVADRSVAVCAAEILNSRFKKIGDDSQLPGGRKFRSGKVYEDDHQTLMEVLLFVFANVNEGHPAYVVDALFDICPALRNWAAYTDLLLEEFEGSGALTDGQSRVLIEVLTCAIRQTVTGEPPTGRTIRKPKVKEHAAVTIQADKDKITLHFVDKLTELMNKFKDDESRLSFLMSIPESFNVNLYTDNHKEKELSDLLAVMVEALERASSAELLRNCVKSLEKLEQPGTGIFNTVNIQRVSVTEAIARTFKENFPQWLAGVMDAEVVYGLESSLKRLAILNTAFDLNSMDLWDKLFAIVQRGLEAETEVKAPIMRMALDVTCVSLIWAVRAFRSMSAAEQPEEETMQKFADRVALLVPTAVTVFDAARDAPPDLAAFVLCSLSDLLSFLRPPVEGEPKWLDIVNYKLSETDQNLMASFVDKAVFAPSVPEIPPSAMEQEKADFQRRCLLVSFCRAICSGAFDAVRAAPVFQRFITNRHPEYSDVLRETVKKLVDFSSSYAATAAAVALVEIFTEKLRARNITKDSKELTELKDYARRFAALFGTESERNRAAVGALHKYCLEFIKAARNDQDLSRRILLFDCLLEFVPRLTKEDKSTLVMFLNNMPNLPGKVRSDALWPFFTYRNTLSAAATLADQEVTEADKHRRGRRVNPTSSRKAHPAGSKAPSEVSDAPPPSEQSENAVGEAAEEAESHANDEVANMTDVGSEIGALAMVDQSAMDTTEQSAL